MLDVFPSLIPNPAALVPRDPPLAPSQLDCSDACAVTHCKEVVIDDPTLGLTGKVSCNPLMGMEDSFREGQEEGRGEGEEDWKIRER